MWSFNFISTDIRLFSDFELGGTLMLLISMVAGLWVGYRFLQMIPLWQL